MHIKSCSTKNLEGLKKFFKEKTISIKIQSVNSIKVAEHKIVSIWKYFYKSYLTFTIKKDRSELLHPK